MLHVTYVVAIRFIVILTATCLVEVCYADNVSEDYFIVSSGSQGGNYYDAGNVLARILNEINPERYTFKVIASTGSIENVRRLKDRFSDFAIVQRDVLIKNYFGDGDKIKNVSIIAPLFQEKFIIYTHDKSNVSFREFKEKITTSSVAVNIGLTSLDGASYKTFSEIASLLGLNSDNIKFIEGNYRELVKKYLSGEIDYVLTFSLPIEDIERANVVYFDDADIRLLTRRMRYLSVASIGDEAQQTLGVWALFVGLNGSISQIGEDVIVKRIMTAGLEGGRIEKYIKNTLDEYKSSERMHGLNLGGLPVIDTFREVDRRNSASVGLQIIAVIIMLSGIFLWVFWIRSYSKKHWKYLWVRYKHIVAGLLLVGFIYLLCIEWLIIGEQGFFQANAIKSSVLDMTRTDLHLWNLVRIFANNDGGVFPISLAGKLATTLSTYIIWIGGISIAVAEFFMYRLIAKRREGLISVKTEGHIIIAGWNDSAPKLIDELLYACEQYHRRKLMVVCVVPDPKFVLERHEHISDMEHRRELVLIKGYIRNKNTLEQCNADRAKIIILLAEDASARADEKTLMRALSIRKYCCEKIQNKRDVSQYVPTEERTEHDGTLFAIKSVVNPVYIIAEVNTEEFVADLRDAGVNGVIDKSKIVGGLLVQSILNPGVSKLINNILSFSEDTNEFYTVDLLEQRNSDLRDRTFDELILPLRREKILLVAIKVIYRDQGGIEIVDEGEIIRLLESEGLYRQIITNPITDSEINRRTDRDDQLITLAASADRLNAGIRAITFP